MVPFSAQDIAAELRRRLPGVPKKKLHKLLYYCQGHHLATFDEPVFTESVSAWDMGPVVGELWWTERNGPPAEGRTAQVTLDEAVLNTVGYVISRYGALSGGDLERLTHNEAPWLDADKNRQPGGSERIPLESMREYFSQADSDGDEFEVPVPSAETRAWLAQAGEWQRSDRVTDSVERLRARLTNV